MSRTSLVVAIASIIVTACGDDPAPTPNPQQPTPSPAPGGTTQPATTKTANKVRGSIKDERGNVVAVPGVGFVVNANGLTATGETQTVTPQVKADGTYEADLVAIGQYKVNAEIKVPWNGANYVLRLAPVQDNTISQLSSDGVVQDFVWKLSGPKTGQGAPANPDPNNLEHWYGVGASLSRKTFRSDLGTGVPAPTPGTKWEFVFTPAQPKLIDGSDAKVVTVERTYDPNAAALRATNVPLGVYEVSGIELGAAGERTPLVFQGEQASLTAPFTPTLRIDYPPYANDASPVSPNVGFDVQRAP